MIRCVSAAMWASRVVGEDEKKGCEAVSAKDLEALGGVAPPLAITPEDHEGGGWVQVFQVKGGKFVKETDWFRGFPDVVATTAGSLIVRGIDRESEGTRSFRLDRISAYTVHRSRFTVRTEAPAPRKTDLVAAFRLGAPRPAFAPPAARVQSATEGFRGWTLPETRAQGPSGWTVKVRLDGEWSSLTASGTVRVPEGDLIRL